MRYSRRFASKYRYNSRVVKTASKGASVGVFLGMGLVQIVISAWFGPTGVGGFINALVGLAFIVESLLIGLERRICIGYGYTLIILLCLVSIMNFVSVGNFGFGVVWLLAIYCGTKHLEEFQKYLQEKDLDDLFRTETQGDPRGRVHRN